MNSNVDHNNNWTVYIHTSPSNKHYVGITSRKPEERWGHNGYGYKNKSPHFWLAIQKYGWGNISHKIIAENLTRKEAEDMEIELIEELQSSNNEYGYNISPGGTGGNQKEVYPVKMYDLDANFLEEYASAAECARAINCDRSRITRCCKHGGKYKNYMFCYSDTNITKPYRKSNQKDFYQYSLDGKLVSKYRTFKNAEKETGLKYTHIRRAVKQYKTHYYGGFIWLYESDIKNIEMYIQKTSDFLKRNERYIEPEMAHFLL